MGGAFGVDFSGGGGSSAPVSGFVEKAPTGGSNVIQPTDDDYALILQAIVGQTAALFAMRDGLGNPLFTLEADGSLTISGNFKLGGDLWAYSANGAKLGSSALDKIALWGQTPIAQPAAAQQAALTNSTGGAYDGTLVDVTTTGVSDPAKVNANFTDVYTLLTAIRTALVNAGIMKGSA